MFIDPIPASAPAVNSMESPGKNGITKPVSANIIEKRIAYVNIPYFVSSKLNIYQYALSHL